MKSIKSFEEYIKIGVVKKIKPDSERAKSLILESERKMASLRERLDKIGIKDGNANDYVEYCYDILMLLVRAKMYSKGYSASGFNAHAAEVSYLQILNFAETDIEFVNKMRYFRNGMLYYGTKLDEEYAKKVVEFTNKNYTKLK